MQAKSWMAAIMAISAVTAAAARPGGGQYDGELTKDNSFDTVRKQSYAKVHRIQMKAGMTYTIDMNSSEFDPYLRLEDGSGKELAADDDSGGNLQARIVFTCTRGGDCRIIATSFAGGNTGRYTIRVREEASAAGGGGGAGAGETANFQGKLTADDSFDRARTQSYAKVHRVHMRAGQTYVIDMNSSEFDPYLRLEDASGKELAADDDSGGNLQARITFVCPAEGDYRIIATSFAGSQTGAYRITVRGQGAPGNVTEGRLTQEDPFDRVRAQSYAKVHRFRMTEGKTYVIDMNSKEFDPYLRLEDEGGQELAADDDSGGNLQARITFRCPRTGDYRVIATSFNGGNGRYTVTVREQ